MAEHRGSIEVGRPVAEVFGFLANPLNLPRWQPAFREAFRDGPDRVRAIGGGVGAKGVAAHLRFVADPPAGHLCWAAASGVGCAGDMRVMPAEAGAVVEVVLRLSAAAERPKALAGWTGDPALDVAAALRAMLAAIREACEDRRQAVDVVSGGTQPVPGATDPA